ncbi:MAG TPA: ABC transporter permease [Hydrogenophaga sp.]|jgi:putative ABC transport system permease protein|uniref:ABC transporter permease n=1 Tax=Hydrogenophaga sp. TaxID=1904254 RepID=UPI0008C2DDE0|nr:FtsX-like permease family protein [Hydrogenophaga sp.]OGA76404.1 MAG: ABC transporter permease [Burkholderiales bacterium GWE1_65_30]OGA91321.1 MAG: ABC transporter permease [Burkholderiales bacterium GWF1_66_17]PKO75333.1 MAG: ABC transporter permease [Betaproteobacteria bacterium HGW-Betaproteobacteria-15]MDO9032466.1 ABC transporter permease [Hydrogenophaga sp.]HAX19962.1 ABC transporter permease [Hydrogenophaga sp.]
MAVAPAPLTVSFWSLGWRSLTRDWRAGELRLLLVAVTLAVAALTAVGFFADRLQGGLARDARALIGGDAVISSDNATPPAFEQQAQTLGLQTTQTLGFPTMGRARDEDGGAAKLVALKAVDTGYPLRGSLRVADGPQAPDAPTRDIPAPGTAWVDAALLVALDLQVGSPLLMGDSQFRIGKVIVVEPDRGAGFLTFAPRVMINAADLPATGLVQPASRLTYRLAVAGNDPAVKQFVQWAQAQIEMPGVRGLRLESLEGGQPAMQQTLERAEKFLNLVALLAALLSAVAVAIAARGFAQRHLDDCAMLRVLGLSQGTMARAYTFEFVLVGLGASVLGVLLGFALHHVFVLLLAGLVESALPAASIWPVLLGLGMGLTLMLAFGLPPVLQLAQVPPLRVIRRDVGQLKPATLAVLGLGVAGFAALLLAASRDLMLGLIAVGGFAAAVAVFALASYGAVRLLRASVNEATAPRALVLATRQLSARPAYAVVQISSLAVGLLALVLLVLLRTDLIASWRNATPPDAPNRFVINVQPEQGEPFQQALRQAGVQRFDWYPMIRGRLVLVNGQPVAPESYATDRAQRLVEREFNLSNTAQRPPHNEVTQGRWTEDEAGGLSVEEGLAEELGLKIGDQLGFDIAGQPVQGRITSLRKVDWGSMRVNFFVIFPVADLPDVPVTYISAFQAPQGNAQFDNALVRQFPNITNVDMSQTIGQVQRVLGQVIQAVEFLFAFALAAGLIVLLATITATRGEREREFAVLRAVGAGSQLLRNVQRIELLGVGLLAGFLASLVAMAVGWALAKYAFQFSWQPSLWVPLAGSVAGGLLALMAGWWGLRSILKTPVVETLRRAAV